MSFFSRSLPLAALALVLGALGSSSALAAPIKGSKPVVSADKRSAAGINSKATAMFRKLLGPTAPFMRVQLLNARAKSPTPPANSVKVVAPSLVYQQRAQPIQQALTRRTTLAARQPLPSDLKFKYSGFNSSNQAVLDDLTNPTEAYTIVTSIWGAPALEQQGRTVTVYGNSDLDGVYFPPASGNSTGGEIYFKYNSNLSEAVNRYNFARLVLFAFWGPRIPAYNFSEGLAVEPWVFGLADAASLQIAYQIAGSPTNFDPNTYTQDVLPIYDQLNRPELGNAYIFSPPNSNGKYPDNDSLISAFRLQMAQAAFTKVYVENSSFFSAFNNNLYNNGKAARVAVSPNELKNYAAAAVPSVEGLTFNDWARRQFVLDATVTTGTKLYAAIGPDPSVPTDTRPGFVARVESFVTNAQGQSIASDGPGFGAIRVYDVNGTDITNQSEELRDTNLVDFRNSNFVGEADLGAGFSPLPSGSVQRLTIKIRLGAAEATSYFPYGVVGTTSSASTFYGVTLNTNNGTIGLQTNSGSQSVPLQLGAFGATTAYQSGPMVQTTLTVNGATFKRNTAWLVPRVVAPQDALVVVRSAGFILDAPPSVATAFPVTAPAGGDGLRMVTFPFFPLQSDEADMLGITPRSALKMARYRPNLAPALKDGDNLTFGINGDRHELYPNISTPVAPGRGYWLQTGVNGLSTTVQGSALPSGQTYEVPLIGGWNQFGVPSNTQFSTSAIKVRYGGFAPVSLDIAQARNWVAKGIYRWLPGGGYEQVDTASRGTIAAYEGCYIFAGPQTGVSLVFTPNTTTTTALESAGWSVPLLAASSNGRDATTSFGVSASGSVAKPPTAIRRVSLRFDGVAGSSEAASNAASAGAGYAAALLLQATGGTQWHAVLDGTDNKERVTLSWGDLANVPKTLQLSVRDEVAKKSQILVAGGHYTYTSNGKARRFTFSAKVRPAAKAGVSTSPSGNNS